MKTTENELIDLNKEMKHFQWFSFFVLVFFILLMATLRAVSNRETKTIQVRNQNRLSCVDRVKPNEITHNPTKRGRLKIHEKTNKLVWIFENID